MIEVAGDLARLLPALERVGFTVDDVLVITPPPGVTGFDSARVEVTGPTGVRHGVRIVGSRVGSARVSWCSTPEVATRRYSRDPSPEDVAHALAASDARGSADPLDVVNDEVRGLLELRDLLAGLGVGRDRAVAATGAPNDGTLHSVDLAVGVDEVTRRELDHAGPYLGWLRRLVLDVESGAPLEWAVRHRGPA